LNAAASHWSSNLLFLIIAIGTEAGIANVWKFSYLAGANGGGLFVALYFIALIVIAVPALMAEMLIGRHGGKSVVGTMNVLVTRDGSSQVMLTEPSTGSWVSSVSWRVEVNTGRS
jgi:NSS family neurotransmitter:Na+ symporter